jgi:xylulokinase
MSCLLGIDLGTSSVKVVVFAVEGVIKGIGLAEYPILTPRIGYAEQDPEQWWRATITAVRQALAEAGHPEILGIGFSGQMHGLVLLDQRKNLVRPAITPLYGDRHQLGSSLCVFGTRSQQVCNAGLRSY